MTRGLLFALGILLAVAQAWAIDVHIDEPQAAPIKLKTRTEASRSRSMGP